MKRKQLNSFGVLKAGCCGFAIAFLLLISANHFAQVQERKITIGGGQSLDGKGKLWAVVVGVSNYKYLSPEQQLKFAHRDAQAFAEFLKSPNGGGFPASQLKLLVNQDASISSIRSALGTTLPRSAEPDDVVVIFFAGHGVVENNSDGYLMAYDSDPQNLYATALAVSEVDRIVTERVKARTVILIADACHSGRLGLTSRDASAEKVLVNRYLDEIGKSGRGVFRLLAARADQLSYEDARWGGGHGVFTYYLLEGLKGKADRDKDSVVRAAELLEYLSEVVPNETKSLQIPRAAGSIDARLPLSVLAGTATENVGVPMPVSRMVALEVRGKAGSEVYVDNAYKGKVRDTGVLLVDQLKPGNHEIAVDTPGAQGIKQIISLTSPKTILNVNVATPAMVTLSPLGAQIKDAIKQGRIVEQNVGAVALLQRLIRESPKDPQITELYDSVIDSLASIGQTAITAYVHASASQLRSDAFRKGAEAFRILNHLYPKESQYEAKYLFCEGRALIEEKRHKEAIPILKKAIQLDGRAAYSYNALGVAYEIDRDEGEAFEAFQRAGELAPSWSLPQFHIGQYYFNKGKFEKAESYFNIAVQFDPNNYVAYFMLGRAFNQQQKFEDAERSLKIALRIHPNYALGYLELGTVYEATKRYGLAANAFENGLRLWTDVPKQTREALEKRIDKNRDKAKK
ncbi:MAG: tetratricopeptide repeat protein [Acidobacteriota bacterium]